MVRHEPHHLARERCGSFVTASYCPACSFCRVGRRYYRLPTRGEIRVGTTACPPYEKQLIGSGSSRLGNNGMGSQKPLKSAGVHHFFHLQNYRRALQRFKLSGSCIIAQQLATLDIEIPAVQRETALFDALAYPGKGHQVIQRNQYRLLLTGPMRSEERRCRERV